MTRNAADRAARWEDWFAHVQEWTEQNGPLSEMRARAVCAHGKKVGHWIIHQRSARRGTDQTARPSAEQMERLNELGMRWARPRRAQEARAAEPAIEPDWGALARWLGADLQTTQQLMTKLQTQVRTSAPRRLADSLISKIRAGQITAGEQLPTVRELRDLGHRSDTVMAARRILQEEGYAVATQQGLFVR